jgi:hypothetical protein
LKTLGFQGFFVILLYFFYGDRLPMNVCEISFLDHEFHRFYDEFSMRKF